MRREQILWKVVADPGTELTGNITIVLGQAIPGFTETVPLASPLPANPVLVSVAFANGWLDSDELIRSRLPADGALIFDGKPIDEATFWARNTCDG